MDAMTEARVLLERTDVQAGVVLLVGLVVAWVARFLLGAVARVLRRRTRSDLDDRVVDELKTPISVSIVLVGVHSAMLMLEPSSRLQFVGGGVIATIAVVVWSRAVQSISTQLLRHFSSGTSFVQPRTLPLFDIVARIIVIGAAIYFTFLAWDINLTAWLASAGIIGIAVGFAAKDTLANLFSGIFILADGPYKVGDYIVIDGELRGRVTRIGLRSTRVLTRDDVEITIPNSIIANSKIVNEMGGPYVKQRIRVPVSVAYGSDVDQVRAVLLECWPGAVSVASDPEPRVRFRRFGASGLDFELLVWIEEAADRGRALDDLHTRVYKAFMAAGIEIPYDKRDVYIKEMPAPRALGER